MDKFSRLCKAIEQQRNAELNLLGYYSDAYAMDGSEATKREMEKHHNKYKVVMTLNAYANLLAEMED